MNIRRVSLSIAVLVLLTSVPNATTQKPEPIAPCRVGYLAPAIGFWTWGANSHVKVYVKAGDFTAEQSSALMTALHDWNSVSDQTGSGVKFEYERDVNAELTCPGCLTIMRGGVFDKKQRHVTELKAYSTLNNQIITYATITVDPGLTNPKALLNAIQHELGHNLGLLDCYSCKKKSTVMNQLPRKNESSGVAGPTACDVAQVREAYRELKIHVRPSPPNRDLMDDGEEPEDDDTPVIIPKQP